MNYGPGYEGWTREGEPGYGPPGGDGRRHRAEPDEGYGYPPPAAPVPPFNGFASHQPTDPRDYGAPVGGYGGNQYGPPQYPDYGGYPPPPPPPGQYHPPTQSFPVPPQPDYGYDDPTQSTYYGPANAPRSVEPPRGSEFGFGTEQGRPPRQRDGHDRPSRPPGRRQGNRSDDRGPVRAAKRRKKVWFNALVTLGVIALVAVCGLGARFMYLDEQNGPSGANAGGITTPTQRDLGTRDVDPQALTVEEVFPATSIKAKTGLPYQILKTQLSKDCGVAATGDLAKLLKTQGCNQVVRATLKTADNVYVITTGLFNLVDEAGAGEVNSAIKPTVDKGKGRFVGYVAGPTTEAFVRAPTYIGFDVRGHYLAYCVIARTDGKPFSATDSDSALKDITVDLVETYMFESVLAARASRPASGAPSASASAK